MHLYILGSDVCVSEERNDPAVPCLEQGGTVGLCTARGEGAWGFQWGCAGRGAEGESG